MSVADYRISTVTAAGSGTLTATGTAVVGVSTAFTTQLAVGDVILVGSEARSVAAIADATHLTLTLAFSSTVSGATYTVYTLTNVETVIGDARPPRHTWQEYSRTLPLGDATERGAGWSLAAWTFDVLTQASRDALKALCAGRSVVVYIRTRRTGAYVTCRAVLVWPEQETPPVAGRVLGLVLSFKSVTVI